MHYYIEQTTRITAELNTPCKRKCGLKPFLYPNHSPMTLHEQLAAARKKKGLTQEELAERSKVTVRTIQRLESGDTVPRAFTLRAIAAALDTPFESLQAGTGSKEAEETTPADAPPGEAVHFLQTLCLSSFSFLIIPFVHFLVPLFLLRRRPSTLPGGGAAARQLVRGQVLWVIGLQLLMLLTVGFNLYRNGQGLPTISYLVPAAAAYAFNLGLLVFYYTRIPVRVVG
jgi:transcriptional regulator with XRE-family HTH domain